MHFFQKYFFLNRLYLEFSLLFVLFGEMKLCSGLKNIANQKAFILAPFVFFYTITFVDNQQLTPTNSKGYFEVKTGVKGKF